MYDTNQNRMMSYKTKIRIRTKISTQNLCKLYGFQLNKNKGTIRLFKINRLREKKKCVYPKD